MPAFPSPLPLRRPRAGWWPLRWLRDGILLLGVVLLVGLYFRDRIGEQLSRVGEQALNRQLEGSGWRVRLTGTRLVDTGVVRIDSIALHFGAAGSLAHALPVISVGPIEIRKQDLSRLAEMDFLPDLIVCRGTEAIVELDRVPACDWQALLARLPRFQTAPRLPQVRGQSCRVVLRNPNGPRSAPWLLYDLELNASPSGNPLSTPTLAMAASCRSNRFESASLRADVSPVQHSMAGNLRIHGLESTASDLDWLPPRLRANLGEVTLFRARSSIRLDFATAPAAGERPWQASGRIESLDLASSRLPLPVSGLKCDFALQPGMLGIRMAEASLGPAQARLEGEFGLPPSTAAIPPWQMRGAIGSLRVETIDSARLPAEVRNLLAQFAPRGTCDLEFDIAWNGVELKRSLSARVQDMSFAFHRFPYPVERCVGSATWRGNEIRFGLQSLEKGQIVDLGGWIRDPGPHATFEISFSCPADIPFDEKLLRALEQYPRIASHVRDLRLRGTCGVRGVFRRQVPEAMPLLEYTVDLKHCQLRHALFDYPLREITGQVHVRGQQIELRNVSGSNAGAQIRVAGGWTPSEGLALRIIADRLALDHQLRSALPPAAIAAWDQLNPEGRADVVRADVSLANLPGAGLRVEVAGELRPPESPGERGVTIRPQAFPWTLQRVAGRVAVSDGRFQVQQFRGCHGQAWVNCDVQGSWASDGWELRLENLSAGGVEADDDLLRALPAALSHRLRQARFDGGLQIAGGIAFRNVRGAIPPPPPSRVALASHFPGPTPAPAGSAEIESAWNLRIDLTSASADLGLPLRNINGMLTMEGRQRGSGFHGRGSVALDSVSIFDAWITGLRGPIEVDNRHLALGRFVESAEADERRTASGSVFGGELAIDAHCWEEDGSTLYYVQGAAGNVALAEAAGCLPREVCETGGMARCEFRCRGNVAERESLTGDGTFALTDARLYELPVMVSVLGSLWRRESDRRAFDTATVHFSLRGDQIDLNRIELNGDAISLIGDGKMDWHRSINLDFYSVMGRNRMYIPVLSELYRAGSQEILWLTVDGTIDQPRVSQQILPGINEGLRMLLEPERMARRSGVQ